MTARNVRRRRVHGLATDALLMLAIVALLATLATLPMLMGMVG